ncbi:MAG: phenylalanine--tRNA ligase subunit beta, partial [Candidatus Ranarchaeia archaeon]
GAVIHGVSLTEANLVELMAMQEDLHWAVGRDRVKAAIGVHDLDQVTPPYTYKAVSPTEYKFVPLQETKTMTLKQILKQHPKGQKFAHLVTSKKKYPLIVDANNDVLSFPPIINGVLTQVKDTTRNFLLDITGPSRKAITAALNIITTSLADDGAVIETVDIEYPDHTETVPDLAPTKSSLSISRTNDLLGLALTPKQMIESLRQVRFDAKIKNKSTLDISIPPYRVDILHEVDLIEEVAVGYGIDKFTPQMPEVVTLGNAHPVLEFQKSMRDIMIGLGYLDVLTFVLVNKEDAAVQTLIPKLFLLLSCKIQFLKNSTCSEHQSFQV